MSAPDDTKIRTVFEALALQAGRAIMAVYARDFQVDTKSDASPVTQADADAEAIILQGLREAFPEIPCVAEEEASAGICPPELGDAFFIVDPLDGTREFVNRNPDFTVNIALARKGVPVVGVVYAPAHHVLYSAQPGEADRIETQDHVAGERRRIHVADERAGARRIVASRSHRCDETNRYIDTCGAVDLVSVGSSLKFCLLAEGAADLYPRFSRTMEWDTAAGDAVLRAAGGSTSRIDGAPLLYGKRGQADDCDFANPAFIASAKALPL